MLLPVMWKYLTPRFQAPSCSWNEVPAVYLVNSFRLWLLPSSTLESMLVRQALELGWSPMKERLDKQSSSCLHMTRCLWRPCAIAINGWFSLRWWTRPWRRWLWWTGGLTSTFKVVKRLNEMTFIPIIPSLYPRLYPHYPKTQPSGLDGSLLDS